MRSKPRGDEATPVRVIADLKAKARWADFGANPECNFRLAAGVK
jgi:hypothetical protein